MSEKIKWELTDGETGEQIAIIFGDYDAPAEWLDEKITGYFSDFKRIDNEQDDLNLVFKVTDPCEDEGETEKILIASGEIQTPKPASADLLQAIYRGRGHNVKIVEIDGEAYACSNWNGEDWTDCWQLDCDSLEVFNECEIRPIYEQIDEDEWQIINYRVLN